MTPLEAKGMVQLEGRLPPHLKYLADEARSVLRRQAIDRRVNSDVETLTPKMRETINMALVARLAQACRLLRPWTPAHLAHLEMMPMRAAA